MKKAVATSLITSSLLLFVASSTLIAQNFLKREGYKDHYYKSLRYGLFIPPDYDSKKSYPLIVYLHGSRDTVSRDMAWYQPELQREHPCIVLTPKCTEPDLGWGDTWHNRLTDETKKTLELVDSLSHKYSVNRNRIYLYGISMGGFGVFYLLAQGNDTFAAAYAVCGGSDEKAAGKIMQTPLWIFHGSIDDIVPAHLSQGIYKEIKSRGGKQVRYTEYPGVKHNSWENVGREKTLVPWLFAQEKGKTHGLPASATNFSATRQDDKSVLLKWSSPESKSGTDKYVWSYQVYRNNDMIAEIDGDTTAFTDTKNTSTASYKIIAVNFFFKESESTVVSVK